MTVTVHALVYSMTVADIVKGLHFTNTAYTLFFEELMRTIQKLWPDQMPEQLPFVFPAWNDDKAWPAEVYD